MRRTKKRKDQSTEGMKEYGYEGMKNKMENRRMKKKQNKEWTLNLAALDYSPLMIGVNHTVGLCYIYIYIYIKKYFLC